MHEIESAEFFHIQRNKDWGQCDNWKVGDVIEIGNKHNKFMKSRYNSDYNMNPELDFEKEFVRLQQKNLDQSDLQHLKNMSIVWKEYIIKTREYIFELERLRLDPELPSRFNCLFVTDLAGINYWKPLLGNLNSQTIYRLSLSGKIHKANEKFVRLNTDSQEFNHDQARKYWAGEDADQSGYEFLFEGTIKVLDCIK